MSKVTVYVKRKFTLNRKGLPPVQFQPGANVVDADVAAHKFVQGLTVGSTDAAASELQVELDAMRARAEAAEAQVAELQAVVDAAAAMGGTPARKK